MAYPECKLWTLFLEYFLCIALLNLLIGWYLSKKIFLHMNQIEDVLSWTTERAFVEDWRWERYDHRWSANRISSDIGSNFQLHFQNQPRLFQFTSTWDCSQNFIVGFCVREAACTESPFLSAEKSPVIEFCIECSRCCLIIAGSLFKFPKKENCLFKLTLVSGATPYCRLTPNLL